MYEPRAVKWAQLLTGTDVKWTKRRDFYYRPSHSKVNFGEVYKISKIPERSHLNSEIFHDAIIPYDEADRCLKFQFENHRAVKKVKDFSKHLNWINEYCDHNFRKFELKIQHEGTSYTTLLEFRAVLRLTQAQILKYYRDEIFSPLNLKFAPSNFLKREHNWRCHNYFKNLTHLLDLANGTHTETMKKIYSHLKDITGQDIMF